MSGAEPGWQSAEGSSSVIPGPRRNKVKLHLERIEGRCTGNYGIWS